MKKLFTIAVTVAVVIALFGAYHHVRAQATETRPGNILRNPVSPPPAVLASHTLLTTYIDQSSPFNFTSAGSGFTPIGNPVTVNCQNAAGCTIGVESAVETGNQTTASNKWGICTMLDGVNGTGTCTYQGTLPTDSSFVTGSFNNAIGVAVGTHTVQSTLFLSSGASWRSSTSACSRVRTECLTPPTLLEMGI